MGCGASFRTCCLSLAKRARFNISPTFAPNRSTISLRSCSLSSSVIPATRSSFSRLTWSRQSTELGGGLEECRELCLLDGAIAGTVWSRGIPDFRRSSRFRAKALLERCWTVGKPVFPDDESFGIETDEDGLRSTMEPTMDGLCAIDVNVKRNLSVKEHNELETIGGQGAKTSRNVLVTLCNRPYSRDKKV